MSLSPSDLKIAVTGGGLAGLAVSLALIQNGFTNITVYEKDSNFDERKQGFGLTLTHNLKGPLAKLNIIEEVLAKDCPSHQHWVFKPSGELLGYYGRNFKTISNDAAISECNNTLSSSSSTTSSATCATNNHLNRGGNIRIPRQALRQIILKKLPENIIHWDRHIKSFEENSDGIQITVASKDGLSIEQSKVDLLIGADGIRSVVRELRDECNYDLPSTPLTYIGISVIIGISSAVHPLITDGGFYVLDGTHRLFVMPFQQAQAQQSLVMSGGSGDTGTASSTSSSDMSTETSTDTSTVTTGISTATHTTAASTTSTTTATGTSNTTTQLTMWQLSFSGLTEAQGIQLKSSSAVDLQNEALKRTTSWLAPVQLMIQQTKLVDIWATPLYDRDPMIMREKYKIQVNNNCTRNSSSNSNSNSYSSINVTAAAAAAANNNNINNNKRVKVNNINNNTEQITSISHSNSNSTDPLTTTCVSNENEVGCTRPVSLQHAITPTTGGGIFYNSCVTVLGDACHPMSMFKGQGCNQSLEDGPLLASWLIKPDLTYHNLSTRLRCFEREMIARTKAKVLASRQAAISYHSIDAMNSDQYGFEGITKTELKQFLQEIDNNQITAAVGADLNFLTKKIIDRIRSPI